MTDSGENSILADDPKDREAFSVPKQTNESSEAKCSKKRPERVKDWNRANAKLKRNRGEEYTDRAGRVHPARKLGSLSEHNPNCRYGCQSISEETRKEIFTNFWKLGCYNLQTSFLYNAIRVADPARRKKGSARARNVCSEFTLAKRRVCKQFFLSTLDVSNKRISNLIVKKKISGVRGVPPKDSRGCKKPVNAIAKETVDRVIEHIEKYLCENGCSVKNDENEVTFLDSDKLTVVAMYRQYLDFCKEKQCPKVKESYYRYIFNTKFKLRKK